MAINKIERKGKPKFDEFINFLVSHTLALSMQRIQHFLKDTKKDLCGRKMLEKRLLPSDHEVYGGTKGTLCKLM